MSPPPTCSPSRASPPAGFPSCVRARPLGRRVDAGDPPGPSARRLSPGPRVGARPHRKRRPGGGCDHPVRTASSRPALAGSRPPGCAAADRARRDRDPALRARTVAFARALARRRSATFISIATPRSRRTSTRTRKAMPPARWGSACCTGSRGAPRSWCCSSPRRRLAWPSSPISPRSRRER